MSKNKEKKVLAATEEQMDYHEMVKAFDNLRKFEIVQEDKTIRKAAIRPATEDEQQLAEAYRLTTIQEKLEGYTDTKTGIFHRPPTQDNMMEYARSVGMWSSSDDVEVESLKNNIDNKCKQLTIGGISLALAYQRAMEVYNCRQQLLVYSYRNFEIYRLTTNYAGDQAKRNYLCVATAVWENGECIFPNIEAFESDGLIGGQVLKQYATLEDTQDDVVSGLTPELLFLRDWGFLTADGDILDYKKQHVVANIFGPLNKFQGFTDEDGNIVEPEWHPSLEAIRDKSAEEQAVEQEETD